MDNAPLDFQKIYDLFHAKILRYLLRMVGEADAEDLTQEVFVKVNHGLKDFRGESQLATWIYRIATNTAIDRLRSQPGNHIDMIDLSGDLVEVEDKDVWTGEKTLSVEQQLVRQQMNDCIRDFISRLPEPYRTVLVLSELEGIKNQEIADILGITLDTVKIRLHRARTKLRAELEAHCEAYWIEGNEFVPDLKAIFGQYREKN
ncbi:MAG: sigma-70 family RNA polymerase sigma factor [Chloroflexi bacterium]|nr:sigma-70 family RNA polymerase sigma factor [Chloroflexota bacterium]